MIKTAFAVFPKKLQPVTGTANHPATQTHKMYLPLHEHRIQQCASILPAGSFAGKALSMLRPDAVYYAGHKMYFDWSRQPLPLKAFSTLGLCAHAYMHVVNKACICWTWICAACCCDTLPPTCEGAPWILHSRMLSLIELGWRCIGRLTLSSSFGVANSTLGNPCEIRR